METTKRVYTKPVILRVQLNHEQAVLSVCSTRASTGRTGSTSTCQFPPTNCRRYPCSNRDDDSSGSS